MDSDTPMNGVRIALVGRSAHGRISVGNWLFRYHKFKMLRLDDGIQKFVRYMYYYQPHKRVTWERRLEFYDAVYKEDNNIHIGYLLRKLKVIPSEQDIIVPDARYINEVQALVAHGFIVVRVTDQVGTKARRMAGMKSAAKGTIKLQEAYGRANEAYPVSYSLENGDLTKLRRNVDRIIEKERAKLASALTQPSMEEVE